MNDFIKKNVTLVIPTYNAQKTINTTLNNVSKKFQNIINNYNLISLSAMSDILPILFS